MKVPAEFNGFPNGKLQTLPLPRLLFTELLPKIDHLAELKLTLHCFLLLDRTRRGEAWIWGDELRRDERLLASLRNVSSLHTPEESLELALERALARNTLLTLSVSRPGAEASRQALFLNTESGRWLWQRVRNGDVLDWQRDLGDGRESSAHSTPFKLYQQNIGLLTPIVADQLRSLEQDFPEEWLCEAIEISVSNNKKSLAYIRGILNRWHREGKAHGGEDSSQPPLADEGSEWEPYARGPWH